MQRRESEQYSGFRRAGIRLAEEPADGMVHHSSERERPILYAIHAFDKAHLVMLAEEGLIPKQDAASMLEALREMEKKGVEKTRLEVGGAFHSAEKYLIQKLGEEVGGRIHLGRSSGDVGVVARRIHQRDKLLLVMKQVNELRAALLTTASHYVAAIMPGYTFGQHAQPVTLGHTYAAWSTMLARDFQRIAQAHERINTSPAGAVILTGTEFPLNRERVGELLGFDRVRENTQDAILPHDDLFESLMTLVLLTDNLARWASDLELWATTEFGFVDLPDRFCGTSSVMPQKKNPNALQVIRGAAADCLGGLVTAFHGLSGPTGFPILERHYAEATLRRCFDNTVQHLQWMTQLVPALQINEQVMADRVAASWCQATDIAGALVREKGLPWRTAHQITGILVRTAIARGLRPSEIDVSLVDEAARQYMGRPIELSADSLQQAMDPAKVVGRRTLLGGPAPGETQRQIKSLQRELTTDKRKVRGMDERLSKSAAKLEEAIDVILGGESL